MRLNDRERYAVRLLSLEAVFKTKCSIKKYTSGKWWPPSRPIKSVELRYGLELQINREFHDLYYDNENSRDADYETLSGELGAR